VRYFLAIFAIAGQIGFSQPPTVVSGTSTTTSSSQQTFRFVVSDPNGASDVNRVYFLVNTNPSIPSDVCHGFYDRASNTFYLYNDSLSVLHGPLSAGGDAFKQSMYAL